jgi:monoamine oxidase
MAAMARTPLARSLKRLFADYRLARTHQLPLDAVRELRASRGITRRQMLVGTAAGAGALALPRTGRAAPNDPKVVIVGAGIAGLTCAVRLADRNIASTVYEASGRAGGRMFSNTTSWARNQVTEWCGELIDTGHQNIRRLAQRFDLKLDDLLDAQPAGTEDTFFFGGKIYPKAQADADFAPVFEAVVADEASAPFPTTFDNFTDAALELDNMSVFDWIESRVPGGHGSPLGQLLDTAYTIEYGADSTEQASLNLIYLLAFQPEPDELAIFGESDERFHIRGGNQQLPRRMAQSLGPAVKFGHQLLRLTRTSGGRYRLTFERGGGTNEVTADFVVLAIPFAVLDEIDTGGAGFSALKRQAIAEQGRGHNGKLQLQFTERRFGNGNSYSDTGYQASWEATRAQPGDPRILVFYSGGSVADSMATRSAYATIHTPGVAADAARARQQIEPVYPGQAASWNGRATQTLAQKSPLSRASYSFYHVGQYTTFAGYEAVTEGGVLFCGEHTSINFQGFMEGGAEQGRRAARELARIIRGRDDGDPM